MTQDKMLLIALFVILSFRPGAILTHIMYSTFCFTNSERWKPSGGFFSDDGEWVLPEFDDFMMSRCPAPYTCEPEELYPNCELTELYPNSTIGRRAWGHG